MTFPALLHSGLCASSSSPSRLRSHLLSAYFGGVGGNSCSTFPTTIYCGSLPLARNPQATFAIKCAHFLQKTLFPFILHPSYFFVSSSAFTLNSRSMPQFLRRSSPPPSSLDETPWADPPSLGPRRIEFFPPTPPLWRSNLLLPRRFLSGIFFSGRLRSDAKWSYFFLTYRNAHRFLFSKPLLQSP